MMAANEHEKRSQEIADSLRKFLIAIHTGGIGAMLAISGSLASQHVHPRWAFWPVLIFVIGLVIIGVSMLLAKLREIRRRDAVKKGEPEPDFTGLFWRSQTWDTISLMLFVLAAVVGLLSLSNIKLTP